ncbi:mechanosensitive ion channel family protein [Rubritalea marina]|uniref:mechanosensitive ion channel family protein n=1 Tax=Rubritalea marina TaxID=361055 RepID=UPI000375031D|nr:mechanosensitive ion channel domain-containing protein [Rubritalea marina]
MNTILAELDTSTIINLVSQWGGKILLALLTLIIGFYIANWVGVLLGKRLDQKGVDPTVKPFLCGLAATLIKVAVVVSAIGTLGVEATSFAAIFASMGLAVGMALSGTLQNFAGGVLLLVFRPFKIGDVIETQGYTGCVKEIQIFQTFLTTPDNKLIMVPNGKVANDSMVNYSAMPERRVDFVFGIGYGDDIDQARGVIEQVIGENTAVITDEPGREPMIVVGELADSSVNFTVRVWVKSADYWDVFFSTNEKVKKAFDAAGVSIPFPQQDVHVFKQG